MSPSSERTVRRARRKRRRTPQRTIAALARTLWVPLALAVLVATLTLPPALEAAGWHTLAALRLDRVQLATGLSREARTTLTGKAGRAAQRALAADPDYAPAYETLGAIYARWSDAEAAAEAFAEAVTRDPGDEVAAFHYGWMLAELGEEEAARDAWRQAGALLYFTQQADDLRNSDPETAQLSAERAIAVDPHRVEGYLALGKVLVARAAYTEALATYIEGVGQTAAAEAAGAAAKAAGAAARAADTPEARAELHTEMGRLLARHLDREDAGLRALEQAVTLDPESATARLEIAGIVAGRGACYDAAAWLAPLLEAAPTGSSEGRARVVVGRCHLEQGQPQSALPYLQEAVHGQDATGYAPSVGNLLLLAQAYRATGRDGDARTAYEWALRLRPDHAGARRALVELDGPTP